MQISPITSRPYPAVQASDAFAKAKQSFDNLGGALESGNLADAKKALAQLSQNAPPQAGSQKNPMSEKMDALSQALDSGDLKGAQDAYADVKKTMAQRPSGSGGRGGGPPPGGGPPGGGGPGGAAKSSSAGGGSSSNKVYDKKDANKDGTVSWKEEQDHDLAHPEAAQVASTTTKVDSAKGQIDATA